MMLSRSAFARTLSANVILLAAAATLALGGCVSDPRLFAEWHESAEVRRGLSVANLGGMTTLSYDDSHGTQVSYLSPNGRIFLWYPGNRRALPGNWKSDRGGFIEGERICFQYPTYSYNPATREFGGAWECRYTGSFVATLVDAREGDVFGLATGQIPFTLERRATSINRLLEAGGNSTAAN